MKELLSAVFWSGITLAVFFGWRRIFLALKHPVLHPILWATAAVASPGAEPTSSGGLPRGNRLAHLAVRTGSCCYGSTYLAAEEIDRL